jgi:serine/threonine-protein kinase
VGDYAPGDLVGHKYRLVRFLDEGAQGSVWLAENLSLRAEVAIKIVRWGPSNPAPSLRLEKEARAAALIPHPAAIRVFDLGWTANGDTFVVMEYLEGQSLGERLTTCGRLSPLEAVRILLPIADVLFVAHQRGIVHRDLKPENVFLAQSGDAIQPKLLDFGIAKLRRQGEAELPITDVGALVGSPAYCSPEQVFCREDVGQAADVWSFCVLLYECLTGMLPFDSENPRELFRQIEREPPVPIFARGIDDRELWEILQRGLSKDPAARWPNMQSLGHALAGWLRQRGVEDDISGIRLDARWLGKEHGVRGAARTMSPSPSAHEPDRNVPVGLRVTTHAGRRSRSNWLVVSGFVVAVVPVVLGYRAAAPDPAPRVEQPKADVAKLVELPEKSAMRSVVTAPAAAVAPERPQVEPPEPAASAASEKKPPPPARRRLDLLDPY